MAANVLVQLLIAVVFVAVPVLLGFLVGLLIRKDTSSDWYNDLKKPAWAPPGRVIGIVWSVLYALMGLAAYLVWSKSRGSWVLPMAIFAVQLAVNLFWSVAFFTLRSPKAAVGVIMLLIGLIAYTMLVFSRVSLASALLLVPYLMWVVFATSLNVFIALHN